MKIVDFGIAKVKDSVVAPSTVNKVTVGTVLYMSPEQLRGGERITAASDIYSMGVIAYEMITGRRPFNPSSAPQLLEMHREGVRLNPIDLRPNLSTEARAISAACAVVRSGCSISKCSRVWRSSGTRSDGACGADQNCPGVSGKCGNNSSPLVLRTPTTHRCSPPAD